MEQYPASPLSSRLEVVPEEPTSYSTSSGLSTGGLSTSYSAKQYREEATSATKSKSTSRSKSRKTDSKAESVSGNDGSASDEEALGYPKELSFHVDGLSVKQLPWTEDDTRQVFLQIEFLQDELPGGRGLNNSESAKIWKESLDNLKVKIQRSISNGTLSRDDSLLQKLTSAMRAIQLVDMNKLAKLMDDNRQAGECIAGKDVLLLCGETGAGKTTTLQYLVGTTFEEVEVDGFLHLNPTNYVDPAHAKFKTSYSREPTTRSLQASTEWVDGQGEIAICDVPSYDVANCLEEDIALGLGMVQALHRAKTVRPVLILSREGMGNRFGNLPESMRIVRRLCKVESEEDWYPFWYAFSKYDYKHRKLLHKQFSALQRLPPKLGKGQQEIFEAFIKDIAEKTNPEAHVILPMDESPEKILSKLFSATEERKVDPKTLCTAFVSEFSLRQFQLQMQLQMHDFYAQLLQEDYEGAIKSIHQMNQLSGSFPEMKSCTNTAREALTQQVAKIWVLVVRSIGKEDYQTALYRMEQLNTLANDFPDAMECSVLGNELLTQSITEPFSENCFEKSIHRMVLLCKLKDRFSEASEAVEVALQSVREKMVSLIEDKQFEAAIKLIKALGRAESSIPSAFVVAQHGLHVVRESLLNLVEEEDYDNGIQLTMQISELGRDFAEANAYVRRILKTIRKRIDQSILLKDYVKAGYLLRTITSISPSLYDGKEYAEHALDSAAQHVCELRMEVVNAFDALLQVKDQRKYKTLLEYAKRTMSKLCKSEPTRLVCAEFYQKQSTSIESDNYKPNYLAILCTPRDCTSESFCVAQIRHLIECMTAEITPFEQDTASMEFLMENRKQLLSVILRLRATSNVFKDCSGGSMAASLYEKAFIRFQDLVESILSVSETSFKSSMDMKEFEFQAWLLAYLIQGFTREREEEDGPDIQIMEELDHRRVTLMLRFENEISDTMELLTDYKCPDFQKGAGKIKPDFDSFFQEIDLSDLESPRQLLLSLSQAPQLCKMMATMLSAHSAQMAVSSLDKSLVELFGRMMSSMEEAYGKLIQELKIRNITSHVGIEDAAHMRRDISLIRMQFEKVQHWSEYATKGLEPHFARLNEIDGCLRILIPKLQERAHGVDDIGPVAFFSSLLTGNGSGGPISCACLGSACNGAEDDFLTTLPVLSKPGHETKTDDDRSGDQEWPSDSSSSLKNDDVHQQVDPTGATEAAETDEGNSTRGTKSVNGPFVINLTEENNTEPSVEVAATKVEANPLINSIEKGANMDDHSDMNRNSKEAGGKDTKLSLQEKFISYPAEAKENDNNSLGSENSIAVKEDR